MKNQFRKTIILSSIMMISTCVLFLAGCKKEEEEPSTNTISSEPNGIWQRYGSPNGYQTDLAVGGITGEPSNRVYMCEHPGSPSAGLYKGYISGNIITWDAAHGLPNAEFKPVGNEMTLYFGVGLVSDAGKYKKGTWTNTCGSLQNSVKKIAVGLNPNDNDLIGMTISYVMIENIYIPMQLLNSGVTSPDCSSPTGYIITPASSNGIGYYIKVKYSFEGFLGTEYATDITSIHNSQLGSECNKFKVGRNGIGLIGLIPM